ncbi:type II secretion system protein GspG [Desulfotomaculum sp. 1211_IL3151]|uniref:type II secretion system protein GspG n=1 Tax=Desulfotomaculum sp. 1211_IL3151 TaxID=3084055 RepID=UPI002FD896BC
MKELKNKRGFTMIEVLVVVTMIGILATIFVPKITNQLDKPRKTRAIIEIKTMKNALDIYYAENNSYPTDAKGIAEVMEEHGVLGGKFGTDKALDPWGKAYYLSIESQKYTIWSQGPKENELADNILAKHDDTEIYGNEEEEAMPTDHVYASNKKAPSEP